MEFGEMDNRFAAAFRLARIDSGRSQAEIAAHMREFGFEMSQPVIGKIERGERKVTVGEAEALASTVGSSTAALVRGAHEWRVDRAVQFLREKEQAFKDAVARFQSAQLALALALDVTAGKPDADLSFAQRELAESQLNRRAADILAEFEDDLRADSMRRKLRDEFDLSEEEKARRSHREPVGYVQRLGAAYDGRIDVSVSALGLADAIEAAQLSIEEVSVGAAQDADR